MAYKLLRVIRRLITFVWRISFINAYRLSINRWEWSREVIDSKSTSDMAWVIYYGIWEVISMSSWHDLTI
jgi:hypothetical protein